jgi:hypothetical protein
VFEVLGNHDNWLDHDRVAAAMEQNGVRLIEDEAVRVDTPAGSIWIAGVSDYWTRSHDIAAALATVGTDTAPTSARRSFHRGSASGLPPVTSSKAGVTCSSRPASVPASFRYDSGCRPRWQC